MVLRVFRAIGILIVVMVLFQLSYGYVRADFNLENWQFYKTVTIPLEMEEKEFIELYPDIDLYSNSKRGFDDLRIIDSNTNGEVPYKVVVVEGVDTNQEIAANFSGLGSVAVAGSSFTAHLKQGYGLHNQVTIATTSKEFLVSVKVKVSFDGKSWETMVDELPIYQLSYKGQVRGPNNITIDYPESSAPLIRVVVNEVNLGELKINGAKIFMRERVEPTYVEYAYSALSRHPAADSSDNILIIDMGVIGLPTNRIEFDVEQTNFHRDVVLEGSDESETWELLKGNAVISSYDTPKLTKKNLILNYFEVTNRYLRVRLVNEDNSPLSIKNVHVSGYARSLIMEADMNRNYLIYYGNSQAFVPSYDIDKIYPYLETNGLKNAQIGVETRNLTYKPNTPWYDRYPWLLTTVVVMSTLVIGLFIARNFRDVIRSRR